jgi:hypothetical protein
MSHTLTGNFTLRDELTPDVNGFVEKKYVSAYIEEVARDSFLSRYVPPDGGRYQIYNGYPEEWARYFVSIIEGTTDFNALFLKNVFRYENLTRVDDTRVGLFALTPGITGKSILELQQPRINIKCAVDLYAIIIKAQRTVGSSTYFWFGGRSGPGGGGFGGASGVTGDVLTTEDGSYIQAEDGSYIIIE